MSRKILNIAGFNFEMTCNEYRDDTWYRKRAFDGERLFKEMPCSFLGKLIKSRESSEVWLALQVEQAEEQDDETLEEITQNHNALLALKLMREKIKWANEEKRFYKALKQIQ